MINKNYEYSIYPIDLVFADEPKELGRYARTCCGKMSTLAMGVIIGVLGKDS